MYLFEHADFSDLINQTAQKLKMPSAFVEKDYWVTYVLYRMKNENINDFIFKGGTSLTKGWNLLDRFSEDIDLLFFPHDLGKEKKRRRLKSVQQIVSKFEGLTFAEDLSDSKGHYRTDCYRYEMKQVQSQVLLPYIKLEMGFRGGDSPSSEIEIQSYIGKEIESYGALGGINDTGSFKIKILDLKRTFTEKLFAIQSAYANNEVAKYYRHYYDVYKLLKHQDVPPFLGSPEYLLLKTHINEMNEEFFPRNATWNTDFATSEAFLPSGELVDTLDRALKESRDLFFVSPPTANEILSLIQRHRDNF